MGISAVVAAGDRGAARQVSGESKVFLELDGLALVARVVLELQHVPEISEVWVIGDSERLGAVLGASAVEGQLRKPLHVVEQFATLYENAWEGYRRVLPRAGEDGRDPETPEDAQISVLYVSGDLPFATADEISDFVRRGLALGCDYAVGLSTAASLHDFLPGADGTPGVELASFNLREGRFRQNNLHLVRPLRMGNRMYIQDVYENRYQKEFRSMILLGGRILRKEWRNLWVAFFYALLHLASLLDRRGKRAAADRVAAWIPLETVERGTGAMLQTRLRFVITHHGGAAIDVDNEADLRVAEKMLSAWKEMQARLGRSA